MGHLPSRARIAVTVIFLLASGANALPDGSAVEAYLRAQREKHNIPGMSVVVVKDGRVVYSNQQGLANVELGVPVTADTVFQIQSITKPFTATAVMMLEEEGKLSLDDPVGKHLEGTPESWKPITLRHLLNHTSGIKDFINEPTASLRVDVSEQEVLEATAPRPLNFAPGEKYAYSNTGYHLLAMVIRKVTGQFYGDFLAERIFKPLEMDHTRVQDLSALIPGRAAGYLSRGGKLANGEYVAQSILSYGGGGIVSTAGDLAKWDAALRSEKLLKKATLERMWEPTTLNDGTKSNYGLGWGINQYKGHRYVQHSGGHVTGFQTFMRRYVDDGLTVIVLINQSGGADPAKIAARVAGMFDPALAPPSYKPIEDKEPQVAAMLKDVYGKASRGELTGELFDAAFWAELSPNLAAARVFALATGSIESMDLVERREENGQKLYRYRVGVKGKAFLVLLALNGDGKICKLDTEVAEE